MHERRVWGEPVEVTLDEFADKVTRFTWTNCTAWRVGEYVFVNDATGGDGGQEYAVLKQDRAGDWWQVESWTCSWMDVEDVRKHFGRLAERAPMHWRRVEPRFEKHTSCAYCA